MLALKLHQLQRRRKLFKASTDAHAALLPAYKSALNQSTLAKLNSDLHSSKTGGMESCPGDALRGRWSSAANLVDCRSFEAIDYADKPTRQSSTYEPWALPIIGRKKSRRGLSPILRAKVSISSWQVMYFLGMHSRSPAPVKLRWPSVL